MNAHGVDYPMIALLKNERLITNQTRLMHNIRERYKKDYSIIVYNGKNVLLYAPRLQGLNGVISLPSRNKKARLKKDGVFVFSRAMIQDVLQLLKNNGGAQRFPRILIISCDIIGRGINIVSRDFVWHLTHMFYRPSASATIPMLMQSMRLAGRYKDNLPLTLHAPENILRDIVTGLQMQREIVDRVMKKAQPDVSATSILSEESLHPAKMPKRSVFLAKTRRHKKFLPKISAEDDDGWTLEEFRQPMAMIQTPPHTKPSSSDDAITAMDPKEFHRLTNPKNGMFKKWADVTNQSAIARFMREGLDPYKKYSKKEMKALCKEYGFTNMKHICTKGADSKSNKNYGQIIMLSKGKYMMHPSLRPMFDDKF
jgi:hypothetical protein